MCIFRQARSRSGRGKDLMKITNVIGTGGIFAYGQEPRRVLQAACWHRDSPESLRPLAPEFLINENTSIRCGPVHTSCPKEALRIIQRSISANLRREVNIYSGGTGRGMLAVDEPRWQDTGCLYGQGRQQPPVPRRMRQNL